MLGATTRFSWDVAGELPLLLQEGSTSYIYGPGGVPIAQIDGSGTANYYHHDQLGSVRLLTDGAGTIVGSATYDAYGRPTASTGSKTPFGFAGEYTDAETGFQYLRARYYDPGTGQFLTRDPLESQTRSPYAYADGNPANAVDPSGLSSCGAPRRCIPIVQNVASFMGVRAALRGLGHYLSGNSGRESLGIALGSAPSAAIGVSSSAGEAALQPVGRHSALSVARRVGLRVGGYSAKVFGAAPTAAATLVDFYCSPTDYGQQGGQQPRAPGSMPTSSSQYLRNQNG